MPRKNKQKLHRSLRLKAEAKQAAAKQSRDRRRAARDELDRAIQRVLTQPHRCSHAAVADATRRGLSDLLMQASLPAVERRRALLVFDAVRRTIPSEACVSRLPWFVLLARQRWVREPGDFVPPSGSVRRKRDALALHLLARFAVPPFLVRALDVEPLAVARYPVELDWAVGALAHVGRGGSLNTLVRSGSLPTPLTRRMQHDFLSAHADSTPMQALRTAQVRAFDGPLSLVPQLMAAGLGELSGPDADTGEPFWQRVIHWLCQHPDALGHDLAVFLQFIDAKNRQRPWSFKGRTVASVRRDLLAWCDVQLAHSGPFPASGLQMLRTADWSIVELRSPVALRHESQALRNCAHAYERLIAKGRVALWSVRRGGQRQALAEVVLGTRTVVQLKGFANREVPADVLRTVTRWASANRLKMAL